MKNKTIKLVSLLVIMIVLTSQAVFAASEKPYTVESCVLAIRRRDQIVGADWF